MQITMANLAFLMLLLLVRSRTNAQAVPFDDARAFYAGSPEPDSKSFFSLLALLSAVDHY